MTRVQLTKEHKPLLTIFDSYDAGLHDLPAEMVRRRAACVRIEEAVNALGRPPSVSAAEQKLTHSWAERACDAEIEADQTPIEDAEAARARHDRTMRLLGLALNEAGAALADAVHTYADEAIREHLAPAFANTVAEARKAVAVYSKHGRSTAAVLGASGPVRAAWLAVDDHAAAFEKLRGARRRMLNITGQPQADELGDFSLIRNADAMWPSLLDPGRRQFGMRSPWREAATTRDLFHWLADAPEAEAWLPTAAEQDARWQAVFGPRVAQVRANRHGAEAMYAAFGGRRLT